MPKSKIFLTKKTLAIRCCKQSCNFEQSGIKYYCDFFDSNNNMCILYNKGINVIKKDNNKITLKRLTICKKEFVEVE